MTVKLASFPNSRNKPRSPTRVRTQAIVVLNDSAGPNILLSAADANRTNLTLRNEGPGNIRYDYFDNPTMATAGPGGGFLVQPGEAINEDTLQDVWARGEAAVLLPVVDVNEGEG